jgi:CelD/BcsL family acetyltransferase involved in cellulose biosynthesis
MHFAPLGSSDAKRIHRLQRKRFPPGLRESEREIRDILANTEKFMLCNMSFGLFENARMIGYVFAWVENRSAFHDRDEEVLYIKEIALLTGYERHLRPMFHKMFLQWAAFTPGLPLEAHAQADALVRWRRLVRTLPHFGITLSEKSESEREGRLPYRLLRMDVAAGTQELREREIALPESCWHYRDDITVSVVSDPRQWLGLKEVWNSLLQATEDHNVFQSFEYLWEWWKYCGIWKDLRVIVIRRAGSVIGVAPLMLEHFPIFGKVVRKLMFITAPMEMNRPKFLFGRDAGVCLPALLAFLEQDAGAWDVLDIDEQLQGGLAAIKKGFADSACLVAESATLCPYIDVDRGWEHFLQGRSKRMRSNIRRLRRKLHSRGEVTVQTVRRWPELDHGLDRHCEIEGASWKAGKNLDLGSEKSHYFFYRSLAKVFGCDGRFELRLLECGGTPVASTFGIRHDQVFQSLRIAHRREYDAVSPGTVLESYELEDLFRDGIARYEFMGSFLANKLRWTESVIATVNVHVYRRRPRLMLFYFVHFVFKRRVKAILKSAGQFDRVDRFLKRFESNPFPRY